MAQEHIDFTTPGGDTVTQALHKAEDNFNDLYGQVSLLNPVSSFKNKLINGNFDFWQRGTAIAAGTMNVLLADRWKVIGIGSTVAPSQQPFAAGQGVVPKEPTYFHRVVVGSVAGAANLAVVQQNIEGVRTFAGQAITLSFWAKADAARNIAMDFAQAFGAGGSPSAAITAIGAQQFALTTAWKKYTATVNIPSIAGKTFGTNNGDILQLTFWLDAGANNAARSANLGQQSGTFDIAQVQVEPGDTATSFDVRPPQIELAMCQRYYEKSYQLGIAPGALNDTNGTTACVIGGLASASYSTQLQGNFKVTKRAVPTVTLYSPATGAGGVIRNFSAAGDFSPASVQIGTNMVQINTGAMAAAASINVQAHWTAESEL